MNLRAGDNSTKHMNQPQLAVSVKNSSLKTLCSQHSTAQAQFTTHSLCNCVCKVLNSVHITVYHFT